MNSNHIDTVDGHWPDRLLEGIWPRSTALWMGVFWMALFVIRPWEVLFPELGAWHVERLFALAAVGVVVFSGKLRFCASVQTTGVLGFLLALTVSTAFALDTALAWEELYTYATLVVFYFVLLSVIRTPYQLFFFAASYVVVMALYLGKAEYEYFMHGAGQYTMGVTRLVGIETSYGGPNGVAASTVLSLPFLHFLWRARRQLTRTWSKTWQRWFPRGLALYGLLATTAIVLTNSRSGMLGFAVFAFLSALWGKRTGGKLKGVAYTLVLLALVWMAMPEDSKNRLRTVWDPTAGPESAHASAVGRIEGMQAGLAMFREYPLTGVGIGNFISYRVANLDGVGLNAHSLVGQLLGETGLAGGVAFLVLFFALFVNCRRAGSLGKRSSHPTLETLSQLATACSISAILLVFFGLFSHNMLRFNWLWLAAFALLSRRFGEPLCEEEAKSDRRHVGGCSE
ncbi:MAG: O-antigen ligase family protein [Planctomycetes bacterium]|nr:O-antigen ligase family protein [Planctomycetota bacterium]